MRDAQAGPDTFGHDDRGPRAATSRLKRAVDLIGATTALILFSPLIVAAVAMVAVALGRPVFFRQTRPGLHARSFEVIKLRTMADLRDEQGHLLPDEQRMTRLGGLLRQFSIDELPGLVNVLRGEMSLVGPRPLLVEYLPRYCPDQRRRHSVRPGITGWAQVNGRNAIDWDTKLALDVWYVDNWSLWLDFRILVLTLVQVLRRGGISAEGYATMPLFTGSKQPE